MNARYRRLAVVIAALVAMSMLIVACGDDDKKSDTTSSTPAAETTAGGGTIAVPEEYKGKTIVVATDATYPPNESIDADGKTIVGMDIDLIKAVGDKLGLTLDIKNVPFDNIIPGLKADKYQVGISSFTDTKEREATVDFVTYFTAGTSFYVKADGGPDVTSIDQICDKKVTAQKGTTQADDIAAQAKKCKVEALIFPDQNAVTLALKSGRADVAMADTPVAADAVNQSKGELKLTGDSYNNSPYGIAFPKGSGLVEPTLAALKEIIGDGSYEEILKKWGVSSGAITDPVINGATS